MHYKQIIKNDNNLKPDWIQYPAENTEFHVITGADEVLVIIGESWTYGENLPGIATGLQRYSIDSQIEHAFGPKLATMLQQDLYQYAVPGNCNFYMVSSIPRIIKHLQENFSYKKINLCVQLTEPGRELAITDKLTGTYSKLYDMSSVKTFNEWLFRYDEVLLNELEIIRMQFGIDVMVWKNFCKFTNKKTYPNLHLVEESWIKFSGKILGKNLEMQSFQSVGWFDDFTNGQGRSLTYDKKEIDQELDKIEISNKFIKSNYLHSNHPNQIAHSLWAYKLYNEYKQ